MNWGSRDITGAQMRVLLCALVVAVAGPSEATTYKLSCEAEGTRAYTDRHGQTETRVDYFNGNFRLTDGPRPTLINLYDGRPLGPAVGRATRSEAFRRGDTIVFQWEDKARNCCQSTGNAAVNIRTGSFELSSSSVDWVQGAAASTRKESRGHCKSEIELKTEISLPNGFWLQQLGDKWFLHQNVQGRGDDGRIIYLPAPGTVYGRPSAGALKAYKQLSRTPTLLVLNDGSKNVRINPSTNSVISGTVP